MRSLLMLACVLATVFSAQSSPAAAATAQAESRARALPWPATVRDLPTTSAEVYLGNLDARIEALRALPPGSASADRQLALAGALYHRYRIGARIADAEAAQAVLDGLLSADPGHVDALRLRAAVYAGFHRFAQARADVKSARAAGATAESLAELEGEIALALGERPATDESARTNLYALAFEGNLRVQEGDLDGASQRFRQAQSLFSDSDPMPLAWLHVQQGIALLRNGRHAEASRFFRAAHERLPGYTLAAEHLAETEHLLGRLDVARELYRGVIADTGSPQFIAALADVEESAGRTGESARLRKQAAQAWQQLLARHPAAFTQHAAEFLLETGDTPRALALARDNLALRRDAGSWLLLAQVQWAAGDRAAACDARRSALATGFRPPELADLAAAGLRCDEVLGG